MIEEIIDLDKIVFLYLNPLGSKSFDFFWLLITNKFLNFIIYFTFLFTIYRKYGKTQAFNIFLLALVLILIVDQTTNIAKFFFGRLRPCHDEQISLLTRLVTSNCGGKFSFFSAHASNSFAIATFFSFIFKNLKYVGNLFMFLATLIAYSRIYVGVHFPLDVLIGALVGISFQHTLNF
jgi:undecaprenyl-diphosphatase